jgi:O-succinylhomoserine sulfhydrylase
LAQLRCINYFPKWNIQTSYFDIKPETIESFITLQRFFFCGITNPAVDIIDLELLGKKKHNLILIIDNCFATLFAATYEMGCA